MKTLTGQSFSRYLIYGILATLPLERIPSLELTHPVSATIRISQVLGLLLIAINLPLLWRSKAQLIRGPWVWLLGFLVTCCLSAGLALDHRRAILVTAYTAFVALLAWTISLRFERDRLSHYLKILIIAALAACAIGFYQFFGDLLGLPISLTGLRPQYTSAVFGFPRIQATGLEPLYFDNFLLIGVGLCLSFYLLTRRLRWLIPLTVFTSIIFVNISRGAAVAALAMATLVCGYALWRRRLKSTGAVIGSMMAAAVIAVLLIVGGSHIASINNAKRQAATKNFTHQVTNLSSGESVEFRTRSRNEAIATWKKHPLLGVGPGNYGYAAQHDDPANFVDNKAIVNNEPLELLAETGLIGTLLFVAFAVSLFVTALRLLPYASGPIVALMAGTLLALIGTAIQYQTFSTLYITHIWVTIGLLWAAVRMTQKSRHENQSHS